MIFNIGRLLEERPSLIAQDNDLGSFFDLLLSIVKNKSLHVSIPALHLWAKLLGSDKIGGSPAVTTRIGDLLETCSHRMIRYEGLPENSSNPSIIFLNDDVDTMPERHAFLGNYSRFCNQIVETIVQKQPVDALYHILSQADHVLDHLYDGEPSFQREPMRPLIKLKLIFGSSNIFKDLCPSATNRCTIFRNRGGTEGLCKMVVEPWQLYRCMFFAMENSFLELILI